MVARRQIDALWVAHIANVTMRLEQPAKLRPAVQLLCGGQYYSTAIGGERYTSSTGSTKKIGTAQRATSAATGVVDLLAFGRASMTKNGLSIYTGQIVVKEAGEDLIDRYVHEEKEKQLVKFLWNVSLSGISLPVSKSTSDMALALSDIALQSTDFTLRQGRMNRGSQYAENKYEAAYEALSIFGIKIYGWD